MQNVNLLKNKTMKTAEEKTQIKAAKKAHNAFVGENHIYLRATQMSSIGRIFDASKAIRYNKAVI